MAHRPILLLATLALALHGCRSEQPVAPSTGVVLDATAVVAEAQRKGSWSGGPEPVSGKTRSGIAVYYRMQPLPGHEQAIEVTLRFEGVVAADATAELSVGDGARFLKPESPKAWHLPAGQASQVTTQLELPPGPSYLHVFTAQEQRRAVRSLPLAGRATKDATAAQAEHTAHAPHGADGTTPPAATSPQAPTSAYTKGASGEPIVKMGGNP